MNAKNNLSYSTFDKKMETEKEKTEPFYNRAQKVKKLAKDINTYIDKLKDELITETDKVPAGQKVELIDVKAKDNYDEPTRVMCGDKQDGRGKKLLN